MKTHRIFISLTALFSSLSFAGFPSDIYPGLRDSAGELIPSAAASLGRDFRITNLAVEPGLLERRGNFGYKEDQISKYFSEPVRMVLDETGMNKDFIKPVPPPGVHPRVIFNPEDVPLIRERLAKTKAGQAADTAIRAVIAKNLTGPTALFAADYNTLSEGRIVEKLDANVPYTILYEAFRCLLDDDKEGGRKVAAAITTLSQIAQKSMDENLANPRNVASRNDARIISQGPTREFTLGLDYDFAYNFMTKEQRDTVRKVLVNATAGMTGIGCETLRSLHTGTSNWISWGCRALFAICAIEGEPGYDKSTYDRFANAQTNFIASIYPTGEAFEGWGKNFMFLEHMVIIAKRDRNLNTLGHASVRSAYHNYFIASMSPWGGSFTFCDSLARSGCKIARNADVLMYHTLFPKDVAGNFIYRNQISGDYANVGSKSVNTHHPFSTMDALCCAIFASDVDPVTEQEEYALVIKNRPLSYFSDDTCNMMTRSAWDKNALYLSYLNRAIPGGHQYCDRSHFSLYGQGRFWSIYQGSRQIKEQYMPTTRSVLMADGQGPSTAEAKCVSFTDMPLATFEATDLSNPWNYQTGGLVKAPAGTTMTGKNACYNDFRLKPSPLPWMNLPIGELPDWYSSDKPGSANTGSGETNKGDWYQRLSVKKAFRTVGLVRGLHPYSLIIDDLQLDDQPHRYVWGMTLPLDVVLGSSKVGSSAPDASEADVVLDETDKPDLTQFLPSDKPRHLLVRVLSASQLPVNAAVVEKMNVPNPPQRDMVVNRLHLTSECVSPSFKLLLFPFKEGEPLPKTTWNKARSEVTVSWADQTDTATFVPGKDGRTRFKMTRNKAELVTVQ